MAVSIIGLRNVGVSPLAEVAAPAVIMTKRVKMGAGVQHIVSIQVNRKLKEARKPRHFG